MQVIMFDPMYDAYGSMARRAGGTVKAVKLNVEDWSVDRSLLKEAFSDKTKLIVVNTPHNPTGKVFSKEDLQFIADLAIQYNAYVLLDEVSFITQCCALVSWRRAMYVGWRLCQFGCTTQSRFAVS